MDKKITASELKKMVASELEKAITAGEPAPVSFNESANIRKVIEKTKDALKKLEQWNKYYNSKEGKELYDAKFVLEENNKYKKLFLTLLEGLNKSHDVCVKIENGFFD